jgi:DNA-binding MarR family transcriptional regulator
MARARPVARQHIQGLVDQLRERGLVELEENPAHRRSHLVRLTEAGRALVATMNLRETAFLVGLRMPVPTHEMQTATETLRAVRERLAHSDAERLVADAGTKAMSAKLVKE